MKRVAYEWGGIACAFVAVVILGYTAVSLVADRIDFELIFGDSVQIRGADGRLVFSDALGNGQDWIDDWNPSTSIFEPPVSSDIGKTVWGFGFRQITFIGGSTVWYLRLPLLIPFVILTVVIGLCLKRVRKKDESPHNKRQPRSGVTLR